MSTGVSAGRGAANGTGAPCFGETSENDVVPPASALALVRIGRSGDMRVLDWALSLRGEHGCAVRVIGVWMPAWWQCLGCVSPTGMAPVMGDERRRAEAWWSEKCIGSHVDVRFVGVGPVSPTIAEELGRCPHTYFMVARSTVSARSAQRLRRRHPGLRVVRV